MSEVKECPFPILSVPVKDTCTVVLMRLLPKLNMHVSMPVDCRCAVGLCMGIYMLLNLPGKPTAA